MWSSVEKWLSRSSGAWWPSELPCCVWDMVPCLFPSVLFRSLQHQRSLWRKHEDRDEHTSPATLNGVAVRSGAKERVPCVSDTKTSTQGDLESGPHWPHVALTAEERNLGGQ